MDGKYITDTKSKLLYIKNKRTMKQQTAVEWLITELNQELNYIPITQWDRIRDLVQRAKAMEKEQIINAHLLGLIYPLEIEATKQAEQYYNETYKSEQ